MTLPQRHLRDLTVSALGLGCMSMASELRLRAPTDACEATTTLHRALELGVTFWDTADVYGFGANEELAAAPVLQAHRAEVFLATKFGFVAPDPARPWPTRQRPA